MFEHKNFDVYDFENIPLNEDCYLMDEKWIPEYEQSLIDFFNGGERKYVGYVGYAAVRRVDVHGLELSFYPNIHGRYHKVLVSLPRDELVVFVGCWKWDEKPHLFVKTEWLAQLYLRNYSVFAMIDAVGVKKATKEGRLSKEKLASLRDAIDALATEHPDISFISFGDTLWLKSNWTVGHFQSGVKYTYRPEVFLRVFQKLQLIYRDRLKMEIYGIFTQGSNEYYEGELLHISDSKNHICLNSLGSPFADLWAIDETARRCIKLKIHDPCELYMDEDFFHSIRFRFGFEKHKCDQQPYETKMYPEDRTYLYNNLNVIFDNLREIG